MENLNEFIGLIILGSVVIYRKYLGAGARACKNSKNKKECINKYRIKGYKAQIKKLRSSIKKCSESKDSKKKCQEVVKNKIRKTQKKLLKLINKEKGKMIIRELKLMAGEIIKESEYSTSAKIQLLKFVLSEDSEIQLKALILDGKVIDKLEEDTIDIINKRFSITLEQANQDRIEETKDFVEVGREVLCKIIESDCKDMNKFENIINFIVNEASDYQVLSMVFEGIVPEETVNEQKEAEYYNFINEAAITYPKLAATATAAGIGTGIATTGVGGALVGLILYGGYAAYKKVMKTYGKRCQTFKGEERTKCLENAKNQALKQQLSVLKSGMNKCKKSKDPVKCSETIRKKMTEVQSKIR